jgi:L-fuconolactonase
MRIDAHQHFWQLTRFSYPWMPEGESVLRRDYLPEDLAPILEEHRFDGSIAVQATTDPGEAQWLLDLATANRFIKGAVVWTDLTSPALPHELDRFQQHSKFKGIRHPVHDEPEERWLLRDDVISGLTELARRGIPYDLLLRPIHLPLIPRIAERVPNLRMVIDHLAKPRIAARDMEGWARSLSEAANLPQVFCKLSGMVTEASPQTWKAQDLQPYIAHTLKAFGPERCMFGSDWPVCRLAAGWKQVLAAFTQACGPLPQAVRDQLLGETAMRFYDCY